MTFIGTSPKRVAGVSGCTGVLPMIFGAAFITETTATRYFPPAGAWGGNGIAPTVGVGVTCQTAGFLTRFGLSILAGAGNGLDIVYTVVLNGVPTAYAITQPSTAAGVFEIVGPPLALADGDVLMVSAAKDSDVVAGPAGLQAFLRIEDTCGGATPAPPAACCPPSYLSQAQFNAYAEIYITGQIFAVDLDASVCGQPPGSPGTLIATIRPSFFAGPPGTPPVVVSAETDPVNNIARISIDASGATDGRYVLELTNDCGCCYLIPLEGVSV